MKLYLSKGEFLLLLQFSFCLTKNDAKKKEGIKKMKKKHELTSSLLNYGTNLGIVGSILSSVSKYTKWVPSFKNWEPVQQDKFQVILEHTLESLTSTSSHRHKKL